MVSMIAKRRQVHATVIDVVKREGNAKKGAMEGHRLRGTDTVSTLDELVTEGDDGENTTIPNRMIGAREVIGVLQPSSLSRLYVFQFSSSVVQSCSLGHISSNDLPPVSLIYADQFLSICSGPIARASSGHLNASTSPGYPSPHTLDVFYLALELPTRSTCSILQIATKTVLYLLPNTTNVVA